MNAVKEAKRNAIDAGKLQQRAAKGKSNEEKHAPGDTVKPHAGLKQDRNFEVLVGKPVGGIAAVKAIRSGFNAHMLKSASGYLGVPEKRILDVVHIPTATAHRLQKNDQNVDPGATERLYRMGIVTRMAIDVFEEPELAKEWLRRPNRSLANEAPLDLLDTEPGAASVRQVLNAIATGGVV